MVASSGRNSGARFRQTWRRFWKLVTEFSRLFRRSAGTPASLGQDAAKWGRKRREGISQSRASISGRRRVEPRTRAGHRRGGARGDRACGHCVDRARPRRRRRSLLKRANRIAFGQRFDQHRGARRRPSGSDRPTGRPSWPTGHATATHSRPRNRSVKRGESKAYETWVAPIRHPYTRISKAVDYHGLNFGPPLSESSASSISRPKPPSAYPSTMRSSSALIASCPPYR